MMLPSVSSAVTRTSIQPNSVTASARLMSLFESSPVGAVLITLVVDGDLDVLPSHIENRDELAVRVVNRYLGRWSLENPLV
jgi:hypothetical protein